MITKLPKKKDKVYALLSDGSVVTHIWEGNLQQQRMYWQGNLFESAKAASDEKQRRVMAAMRETNPHRAPQLKPLYKAENVSVTEENGKEYLVMDGTAVDFETILRVCQEFKKQHG